MSIEPSPYFNEPMLERNADVVPQAEPVSEYTLGQMVASRLVLENRLRVCGLTRDDNQFELSSIHKDILVLMLAELDSPISASLRANTAGVVGAAGLQKAVPLLKAIAVDEEEDLKTRVNSIQSYVKLDPAQAATDLATLLNSSNPYIRTVTYISALKSEDEQLIRIAATQFKNETNTLVRSAVIPQSPTLQADESTRDVTSSIPDDPETGDKPRGLFNWLALNLVILPCALFTFLGWQFLGIPFYFVPAVTLVTVGALWAFGAISFRKENDWDW